MEVDPAVHVASQSQPAAPVPPTAVTASRPTAPPHTKVEVTAKLAAIGMPDGTKKFPSSEEAKEFIKENLFLQSHGKRAGSNYTRFICRGCDFTARPYVNVAGEAQLTLPEESRWHDAECARVAKGRHGLSTALRASALLEKQLKRVATAKLEAGGPT